MNQNISGKLKACKTYIKELIFTTTHIVGCRGVTQLGGLVPVL